MTEEERQAIARAVADPRRYEILKTIASHGEMPCSSLRDEQPIAAATLSHHLRELGAAGLVEAEREGKHLRLTFNKSRWREYVSSLKHLGT